MRGRLLRLQRTRWVFSRLAEQGAWKHCRPGCCALHGMLKRHLQLNDISLALGMATQSLPLPSLPAVKDAMYAYGKHLGLAFQIVDDILDYTQNAETLGKPQGQDLASGNLTAPAYYALQVGGHSDWLVMSWAHVCPVRGRARCMPSVMVWRFVMQAAADLAPGATLPGSEHQQGAEPPHHLTIRGGGVHSASAGAGHRRGRHCKVGGCGKAPVSSLCLQGG